MHAKNDIPFFRLCLRSELASRCDKNPHYSLRAFSKAIGLSPASLSRVLSGKRALSLKAAKGITEKLNQEPVTAARFMDSIAEVRKRASLRSHGLGDYRKAEVKEIELENFRVISELYHYALLELTYVEGFRHDPRWIARVLGITVIEAQLAVDRLVRLGFLQKTRGRLKKAETHITTKDKHVTTGALRRHMREILQRGIDSLERDPIEERDVTGMTMAIDPAKLPIAKKMIQDFTYEMCSFLENGKRKRVYQLGMVLYPLQKKEPK